MRKALALRSKTVKSQSSLLRTKGESDHANICCTPIIVYFLIITLTWPCILILKKKEKKATHSLVLTTELDLQKVITLAPVPVTTQSSVGTLTVANYKVW